MVGVQCMLLAEQARERERERERVWRWMLDASGGAEWVWTEVVDVVVVAAVEFAFVVAAVGFAVEILIVSFRNVFVASRMHRECRDFRCWRCARCVG